MRYRVYLIEARTASLCSEAWRRVLGDRMTYFVQHVSEISRPKSRRYGTSWNHGWSHFFLKSLGRQHDSALQFASHWRFTDQVSYQSAGMIEELRSCPVNPRDQWLNYACQCGNEQTTRRLHGHQAMRRFRGEETITTSSSYANMECCRGCSTYTTRAGLDLKPP